jgi:predicted GNAT family acetyltransferase
VKHLLAVADYFYTIRLKAIIWFIGFFIGLPPMGHVLDNPAWSAMISGNKHLCEGNEKAKYFIPAVSVFAGLQENSTKGLVVLSEVFQHNIPVIHITKHETKIPEQWKLVRYLKCLQMIYDTSLAKAELTTHPVKLTTADVPQMLALTKLTNPGPFAERTIEFGHYYGIFDGDKLVAMAGQRMHSFEYAEISAVCTHPDYLGRGYARQLLQHQIQRIMAAGDIPYLHVRDDNERPIQIYESLGFKTRVSLHFYVLQKN